MEFAGASDHVIDRGGEARGMRTCAGNKGEEEASRLVAAALDRLEVRSEDLASMRKGDPRKLAITALVRQRTTASNAWLAENLHLGHACRANQASRDPEAQKLARKLALELPK